jgi:uncharacterized repeat protein (TIGR01451 family)
LSYPFGYWLKIWPFVVALYLLRITQEYTSHSIEIKHPYWFYIYGFNMAIIGGLFATVFSRLLGPRKGALAAVAGIAIYTVLVGANPAVVRSAMMSGSAIFARQVGRRQDGLNTLSLVGAVMALFHSFVLWEIGFQLSFMATLGLVLYAGPLNYDPEYGVFVLPAVCRTSALSEGSHEIRTVFTSHFEVYRDASRTLTQIVQASEVASADLSIDKTDSKDPVKPGAKLVYTLVVKNADPDAAQNLTLVDTLDRNTIYVSTSAPKGWTCTHANSKVTCTSDTLASGSSATIKITVTVSKTAKVGKALVNNASVSSETFDPDLLNNSVVLKTLVVK